MEDENKMVEDILAASRSLYKCSDIPSEPTIYSRKTIDDFIKLYPHLKGTKFVQEMYDMFKENK